MQLEMFAAEEAVPIAPAAAARTLTAILARGTAFHGGLTLSEFHCLWYEMWDAIEELNGPLSAQRTEWQSQLSRASKMERIRLRKLIEESGALIAEAHGVAQGAWESAYLAFFCPLLTDAPEEGRDWLHDGILSVDRACEIYGDETLARLIAEARKPID